MAFRTEQEKFWAGEFGNEYISRNISPQLLSANTAFFSEILHRTEKIESVIEFGANVGMNLYALRRLLPEAQLAAIEINSLACETLRKNMPDAEVFEGSILDYFPRRLYDLALVKGVLIHIAPDALPDVYDKLYEASSRYICIAEYYNPTPVAIPYRGHENRLFKRDFAGDLLERHPDLRLIDYGFAYHRDNNFRQDDISWFLLGK